VPLEDEAEAGAYDLVPKIRDYLRVALGPAITALELYLHPPPVAQPTEEEVKAKEVRNPKP
jgi:hypothetical protein